MSNAAINVANVMVLTTKWGLGPATGGLEVVEFANAMQEAGLSAEAACVLAAWMGGAPSGATQGVLGWKGWFDYRTTAEESCQAEHGLVPDALEALEQLKALSAELADLVMVKAQKKDAKETFAYQKTHDEQMAKFVGGAVAKAGSGLSTGAEKIISALDLIFSWKGMAIAFVVLVVLVVGVIYATPRIVEALAAVKAA